MIDCTRYAIVAKGVGTASGYDEIKVRTVLKKDAERILQEWIPNPRQRNGWFKIVKLPKKEI